MNTALNFHANPVESAPALATADFFDVASQLPEHERQKLADMRAFLTQNIRPHAAEYWTRDEFPHHLLRALGDHGFGEIELEPGSRLFKGLVYAELARADLSLSTLVGIHNELIVGGLMEAGSPEQQARWIPLLRTFRAVGSFALTEPEHGSDIAKGLCTTATREGDEWVINGFKRWIGGATFADFLLVFARDTADHEVKGFLVETNRPGVSAHKIQHKTALRIIPNADITLDQVRIPLANALTGAANFSATNVLLRNSRAWVGWEAAGAQMATFDVVHHYATTREQFGHPLAEFQLVQQPIAKILGNATASLAMMAQLARLQEEGRLQMEHAALVKASTTTLARESAQLGRGLLGGNGILADREMGKIFADVEAIYTYEGTYEVNSLIVGRAVTGASAFV
ncbi:glutaryl-CoA dehydrogenase [Neomicrococcus aestuarii]|uniref:Glutaryl-CoA dehydrogenase n=1 Tax=Neomicrococcus aestuarii TaxID=556325 RepID=A0A7W8TWM3_9MICC|nr:acyl-CoA dehydrogenase family protein [Neomicrococcus aestuarii]MBB5512851.1 glutaryl-CoA dehydrogenase [Neomicrococcus aestuarii]